MSATATSPERTDKPAPPDEQALLQHQFARIARLIEGAHESGDGRGELPERIASLAEVFGLTPFELDVLLLSAGAEVDGGVAAACAAAQGDAHAVQPTFGLALVALPRPHWSALATSGPLRHWRLIELRRAAGLTTAPLALDDRVLEHILGIPSLDARLEELLAPIGEPLQLDGSHHRTAERLAAAWRDGGTLAAVQLTGGDVMTRRAIACRACAALGLDGFVIDAADLPTQPAEREGLIRLWNREALIAGRTLLVEVDDVSDPEARRALAGVVRGLVAPFVVGTPEPLVTPTCGLFEVAVQRPDPREREQMWRAMLPRTGGAGGDRELRQAAAQFELTPSQLRTVGAAMRVAPETGHGLWGLCRSAARAPMDGLAQRIESRVGWDDLVLPAQQLATLRELAVHVRQRARVHGDWGFVARSERGLGLGALFAGPSGTGKTLAAEVIANELELDLYRIDLSAVVSKYIGETEKNLRRLFDAAESAGAVLLFDEADALFAKRSTEVRDSHDRYSRIEVAFLLAKMESHRTGLAILTTNHPEALDDAFTRRLRFTVRFPFPDPVGRLAIWTRAFPPETPVGHLDFDRLARLNVSGATIRNIALGAAFRAAEDDSAVGMEHVLSAARTEYVKLGRPLPTAELGARA